MSTTEEAIQPLTPKQEQTVYTPDELWTDDFAVKVAIHDFNAAEAYRTQNQDWKWRNADELYQAWVVQKFWEGTRIPRASIGVYVAFEQIESMLPKILGAIFGDNPWFQADPIMGTSAEQARQWRNLLLNQLDETRVREIFRRCIKSALIYGNGIMKLSWDVCEYEKASWIPRMQPKQESQMDALAGMQRRFSGYERVLDKKSIKGIKNAPILDYYSIKDCYFDPNCSSPQIQDGRYFCTRRLVSVDDLDALREKSEYKIPDKNTLLEWARHKPSTQGDSTKSMAELYRLGFWSPQIDQTVDPGGLRIEVIEYITKDRLVWVGNRSKAILNMPNSYGFINYYNAFYTDVLDRPYSMGVCEVVEGEQRLQSSVLNARLDELALSIHRPVKKKRGVSTPQYMLRVRPGQVVEVTDKDDYSLMETENITANAYVEVNASELRVQKTTGQADLYASGVPSSGGNSASRTATGIGAQVQASGSRIQYLVENLEDSFITPMLNDLVKLNQMFPPIGTSEAEAIAMSQVKLSMRASAKMQSRMSLLQTFPLVFQTLANPAFVSQLAAQGVTPNWAELMAVLTDMTGYRNRADLIRPLTPEEKQQLGQPPATEMIRMQMQKERIEGQERITDKKLEAQKLLEGQKLETTAETEDNYAALELIKAILQERQQKERPTA